MFTYIHVYIYLTYIYIYIYINNIYIYIYKKYIYIYIYLIYIYIYIYIYTHKHFSQTPGAEVVIAELGQNLKLASLA